MCGCGRRAPVAKKTKSALGHRKGQPVRFIHGHHRRGKKCPTGKTPHNFRWGYFFASHLGRWMISCRDGSKVLYYRAVMEASLGRHLTEEEVVHHINGDRAADRIENLKLYASDSEHQLDHQAERREARPC